MAESMEASYARFRSENNTRPLLELNLELNRSCAGPPFRTTSPESADVEWHLTVNKLMDAWYLKIHRSGQRGAGRPLYCICDIPDFAFYFEYYFAVGTSYIMLIPKFRFDEGDPPVNITCKVLKRIDRCDLRSETLNFCSETIWWEFPKTHWEKKTWRTGFCTVIKSHSGRTYPFEVVLYRSGDIYIEIQRRVPGNVHFWGEFLERECYRDFTFDLTLSKGHSRVFVGHATQFTFMKNENHEAFCCTLFFRADFPDVTNCNIAITPCISINQPKYCYQLKHCW